MDGVSAEFFSKSLKLLTRIHGDRLAEWDALEAVRLHLQEAEKAFKGLPMKAVPLKKTKETP